MLVNPILAAVALVLQVKHGAVIGQATGFFFAAEGGERFFVTNRHVVLGASDEGPPQLPDTLRVRLHVDQNDLTKNDDLAIVLYDNDGKPKWKGKDDLDVVLVPLAGLDLKRFVIQWLDASYTFPSNYVLAPGEDVFIIGYPQGFYDGVHNLPVMRNALIASAYGVPFQGRPLFLTDAKLHPGTSGSPVFTKPKNIWTDTTGNSVMAAGTHYYLLGISSGTIRWPPSSATPDPLGLGVAWYASLLNTLAKDK